MGFPKEKLRLRSGSTLLQYQIDRSRSHFSEILLLGGASNLAQLEVEPETNLRWVPDPETLCGEGPLAGLLAGLEACSKSEMALLPVDQPFFPPALWSSPEVKGARVFRDFEGRLQWMGGFYHKDLLPRLREFLAGGGRSLGAFVRSLDGELEIVDCRARDAFASLNTPAEARAAGFFPE